MGLFKKKPVKEIHDGLWGHLVSEHHIDVDTLGREIRCVEREGTIKNGQPVTLVRVFKLGELSKKGITVTGWETFDEHPEFILYEGYLGRDNIAFLEKKRIQD
jgi:hypothetical protein